MTSGTFNPLPKYFAVFRVIFVTEKFSTGAISPNCGIFNHSLCGFFGSSSPIMIVKICGGETRINRINLKGRTTQLIC
ncbi:hypothetical protein SAMN05421740_10131 [Parapedobacter koreensis]|uniref:Uncharacterized protein n=1 Tax=Parapedobacter koreensis TaxID=332977 RepID=A0A1H7EV51_9SPHI|nr:hypothetical protein SAMN05421740_10131 [Parapedobacter koreensis]